MRDDDDGYAAASPGWMARGRTGGGVNRAATQVAFVLAVLFALGVITFVDRMCHKPQTIKPVAEAAR